MSAKKSTQPIKRSTRQRAVIRETIEGGRRPLTPNEIHTLASRNHSGISIATVYRAIKDLQESGEISAVDLPGEASRYELTSQVGHHHHFQCDRCKRVFEIKGCPGNMSDMVPPKFEVHRHHIVLYGDCPDCAPKGEVTVTLVSPPKEKVTPPLESDTP